MGAFGSKNLMVDATEHPIETTTSKVFEPPKPLILDRSKEMRFEFDLPDEIWNQVMDQLPIDELNRFSQGIYTTASITFLKFRGEDIVWEVGDVEPPTSVGETLGEGVEARMEAVEEVEEVGWEGVWFRLLESDNNASGLPMSLTDEAPNTR